MQREVYVKEKFKKKITDSLGKACNEWAAMSRF